MSKVTIFSNSCKGTEDCGICILVCPRDLFESSEEMNSAGYVPPRIIDEERCNQCMNCMISCPDMAIVVKEKKKKEPNE